MVTADRGKEAAPESAAAAGERIAAAWHRLRAILERRPSSGLLEDAPAVAHWTGGTGFVIEFGRDPQSALRHAQLRTDLSEVLGGWAPGGAAPDGAGGADGPLVVSPGWLLRAALASCVGTLIVVGAAARGLTLQSLELEASSRSDLRGMLGLTDRGSGKVVSPAPQECRLQVRIGAVGASADSLRELVAEGHRLSPVSRALQGPLDVSVRIL
jgi:uncharacterized OsmC-like protein